MQVIALGLTLVALGAFLCGMEWIDRQLTRNAYELDVPERGPFAWLFKRDPRVSEEALARERAQMSALNVYCGRAGRVLMSAGALLVLGGLVKLAEA